MKRLVFFYLLTKKIKLLSFINLNLFSLQSSISFSDKSTKLMYEYARTSLINDKARVYKGGSWRDRAYFLNPGTRRYLDQDKSSSTIGFRCAISAFGIDIPSSENDKPWWKKIKIF